MLTRRNFIGTSALALAPNVPRFVMESARACVPQRDGRILVVLQLGGGNDGLNTVVPFRDPGYREHRKTLALPADRLLRLNDALALHPSMTGAHRLFEAGHLAVYNAVGYPNPNRSHDVSMAIWHSARFDSEQHDTYGWLGRAFDESTAPRRGPVSMLAGDDPTPLALRGRRAVTVTVNSLDEFKASRLADRLSQSGREQTGGDLSTFLERQVVDAAATARQLRDVARQTQPSPYPATQLGRRLQLISQLIQADLGTRVFYAIQPGYDTHSLQLGTHARLLAEFSSGLEAFLKDLTSAGLADRVAILCFSEFGRRVAENASAGTDHGTAGPVFLAGPRIKPGLHGPMPSLSDLEDGDLKYQLDFRSLYGGILKDWLNLPTSASLGRKVKPIDMFS